LVAQAKRQTPGASISVGPSQAKPASRSAASAPERRDGNQQEAAAEPAPRRAGKAEIGMQQEAQAAADQPHERLRHGLHSERVEPVEQTQTPAAHPRP